MYGYILRKFANERGQTMTEYALIIAVVALGLSVALLGFGATLYEYIASAF